MSIRRSVAMGDWHGHRVFALGHSTLDREVLLGRLLALGVVTLVDIRSYPRSRHNPQFDSDALAAAARARGLGYAHLRALGGRRRARGGDETNAGWRSAAFRGYADHMQTEEFAAGLHELRALAEAGPVAILCSEAVPWRCHRSLVADALLARGAEVLQVIGDRVHPHRLTPFARIEGERITYPPPEEAPAGDAVDA
ncbi:DUF488 family protein [Vulgatibacter sp.]|uniref:DUF488 domain-containing protein n=1 Tax=Vulgatibacter sp. TaxID=1971226 RepID=UPI00356652DF